MRKNTEMNQDSFKGQMAARYRERLSMGYGVSALSGSDATHSDHTALALPAPSSNPDNTQGGTDLHVTNTYNEKVKRITNEGTINHWWKDSTSSTNPSLAPTAQPRHILKDRSLLGERDSSSHRPGMKELITKFERRSSSRLGVEETRTRIARDAWRSSDEGSVQLELDPNAITSSSTSDDLEHRSLTSVSKPLLAKQSHAELNLDYDLRPPGQGRLQHPQPQQDDYTRIADTVVDADKEVTSTRPGEGRFRLESTVQHEPSLDKAQVVGETLKSPHTQSPKSPSNVAPKLTAEMESTNPMERATLHDQQDPLDNPVIQRSEQQSHVEAANNNDVITAPLRTNLRGIASKTKQNLNAEPKYTVHKKEWKHQLPSPHSQEFGSVKSKLSPPQNILKSIYEKSDDKPVRKVHRRMSETKRQKASIAPKTGLLSNRHTVAASSSSRFSASGTSLNTPSERHGTRFLSRTPSNTQQRINSRNVNRLNDTNDANKESSKSKKKEKKATAMERYLQFLKRTVSPLQSSMEPAKADTPAQKANGFCQDTSVSSSIQVESQCRRAKLPDGSNLRQMGEPVDPGVNCQEETFPLNLRDSGSDSKNARVPKYLTKLNLPRYPRALRGKENPRVVARNRSLPGTNKASGADSESLINIGYRKHASTKSTLLEPRLSGTSFRGTSLVPNPPKGEESGIDIQTLLMQRDGLPTERQSMPMRRHVNVSKRSPSGPKIPLRRQQRRKSSSSHVSPQEHRKNSHPEVQSSNFKHGISDVAGHLLTDAQISDNDLIPYHLRDSKELISPSPTKSNPLERLFESSSSGDDSCSMSIEDKVKKIKAKRLLKMFQGDGVQKIQPQVQEHIAQYQSQENILPTAITSNSVNKSPQPRVHDEANHGEEDTLRKPSFSSIRTPSPRWSGTDNSGLRPLPSSTRACAPKGVNALVKPRSADGVRASSAGPHQPAHKKTSSLDLNDFASAITLNGKEVSKYLGDKEPNRIFEMKAHNMRIKQAPGRNARRQLMSNTSEPCSLTPYLEAEEDLSHYATPDYLLETQYCPVRAPSLMSCTLTTQPSALESIGLIEQEVEKDDPRAILNSQVSFHFGMCNTDDKSEAEKASPARSPKKKKRKVEKNKKKTKSKKRKETDDEGQLETSQQSIEPESQAPRKYHRAKQHHRQHKDKRWSPRIKYDDKPSPKVMRLTAPAAGMDIGDRSPKLRRMSNEKRSLTEGSIQPLSGYNRHGRDSSPPYRLGKKEPQQPLVKVRPVKRLISEPTLRCPLRSHIPLLALGALTGHRKPLEVLMRYRRWREEVRSSHRPSRIPVSQTFLRALDMAVLQEWSLHCWESPCAWEEDQAPCSTVPGRSIDTEPKTGVAYADSSQLVHVGSLVDTLKLGPIRLAHMMYLWMALTSAVLGHVGMMLYNCGGDEFEYFCPEDDLVCLTQLRSH